jgi:hypothetical protein
MELFELADLLGFQSGIAPLSPIEGLFGNPQVTDQIRHRCPHRGLLQYGYDLLDTESFAFHGILLPSSRANYAGNSPSVWYEKGGTDEDYSRNIHEEHELEDLTKKGKTMCRTSPLG